MTPTVEPVLGVFVCFLEPLSQARQTQYGIQMASMYGRDCAVLTEEPTTAWYMATA